MKLSPARTGFVALALVAIALALLRPICDPDFLHVAKPQAASLATAQGAGDGQAECSVSGEEAVLAPVEALVHYADAAGLSQAPGFAIAQPAAVILRWAASTAPPLVSKYYARSARVLR